MAQQLLHNAQVGPPVQHVRRKAVAQHVRVHLRVYRHQAIALHHLLHGALGKPASRLVEEKRIRPPAALQPGPTVPDVMLHSLLRGTAHYRLSLLGPLAHRPDHPAPHIHVAEVQAGKLAHAQARGVEQFEDGAIAHQYLRRLGLAHRFRGVRRVEQTLHLLTVHDPGQQPLRLGYERPRLPAAPLPQRVGGHHASRREVAEEGPERGQVTRHACPFVARPGAGTAFADAPAGHEPRDVSPEERAVNPVQRLDFLLLQQLDERIQVVQVVAHGELGEVALSDQVLTVAFEVLPRLRSAGAQTVTSTRSSAVSVSGSPSGAGPRKLQAVHRAPFRPDASRSSPHSGHGSVRGRCATVKSHVG